MALFDAAMGMRVRRVTYRASFTEMEEEMSEQTATRDLRQLVDAGFLIARCEKRGRFYVAIPEIVRVRREMRDTRDARDDADPFAG